MFFFLISAYILLGISKLTKHNIFTGQPLIIKVYALITILFMINSGCQMIFHAIIFYRSYSRQKTDIIITNWV